MSRPPMISTEHRVRRADTDASARRTPDAIESHDAPGASEARPCREPVIPATS